MQKVMLSTQEIGAIEAALKLARACSENKLPDEKTLEWLEEYNSDGTIDELIEMCEKYD